MTPPLEASTDLEQTIRVQCLPTHWYTVYQDISMFWFHVFSLADPVFRFRGGGLEDSIIYDLYPG